MVSNQPVLTRAIGRKMVDTLVLLKHRGNEDGKPLFLIVQGMRFERHGQTKEDQDTQDKYFYESATCPTNFLKRVRAICVGDSADPHGEFEYVETVVAQGHEDETFDDSIERWVNVFSHLRGRK